MLNDKLKEDFLIKSVFYNTKEGFETAGIKRAYLDFNRTLKILDGNLELRNSNRSKTQEYLKQNLLNIISLEISNQEEFDELHRSLCENLVSKWNELKIGQAQKWINMTLKYWLLFGGDRIKNIEKNAKYFHIPIDSLIQNKMFKETNPKPWSKITNYEDYFKYQTIHRLKNIEMPPIIYEFEFYNSI